MCKMNVNLIHLFFVKNTYRKGLFIMSKKLVAFFSASGTTKKVAEMIAEEVKAQLNLNVDKKKIQLKEAIKTLGTHNVSVKLHPQVTAELKVVVQEEA